MRHAKVLAATLVAVSLLLGGCAAPPRTPSAEKPPALTAPAKDAFPVTVKDDLQRTVTVDKLPERIVSLAPADTEILFALGLGPKVVGVTTYDDYPPEVASLPKVGDFTAPNMEAIAASKPDVVLVTGGIQMDVVKKLEGLGAKVVAVDPASLDALYDSIAMVGKVTGSSPKAEEVVGEMKAAAGEVSAKLAGAKPASCFIEVAQNPLFTTGTDTLMNDLVTRAGGTNVVKTSGYVGYSLEQLVKDDPSVYMATKGSMSDPSGLAKRPGFARLSAVKNGRVAILDDNLVSRPGPRIVEGLRRIAEALHPEAFGK